MLRKGHSKIFGFGKAAPLMRMAKSDKAFMVQPLRTDTFLLVPTGKKIKKLEERRKKYSFYEIF